MEEDKSLCSSLKMGQLQRLSGAGSALEQTLCDNIDSPISYGSDWLRDVLVLFISSWFSNDLLAQVLQTSLSDVPQLRPIFTTIERHLANYAAADKQKQLARKVSKSQRPMIAAIIHESALV